MRFVLLISTFHLNDSTALYFLIHLLVQKRSIMLAMNLNSRFHSLASHNSAQDGLCITLVTRELSSLESYRPFLCVGCTCGKQKYRFHELSIVYFILLGLKFILKIIEVILITFDCLTSAWFDFRITILARKEASQYVCSQHQIRYIYNISISHSYTSKFERNALFCDSITLIKMK